MSIETKDIFEGLESELTTAVKNLLKQYPNLRDSDLVNSVEFNTNEAGVFELIAFDYLTYVSTGRRPGARKVPVEDLLIWIKDNNITAANKTQTQLAYAIQASIFKSGIKGKNYLNNIVELSTDIISEGLATELATDITNNLVDAIEGKL